MSLADYHGGNYLGEGEHLVTIKGCRFFEFNSGSPGVEFEMADAHGRTMKHSFCMKDTILWVLANFAEACGIDRAAMARIDPDTRRGFQAFTGKRVRILCAKGKENAEGKRYVEVIDFFPADAVKAPPRIAPAPTDDAPPPMTDADIPADVDEQGIPF